MSNIRLNSKELSRWFADKGDYTHNINYDLNEDSTIMDLGGYKGVWAEQMISKYNPNVYIIEPVPEFYNIMKSKFKNNSKIKLLNAGIGKEDKENLIFVNADGTSSNLNNGTSINVKFKKIENVFKYFKLKKIDLVQINIEGDEYWLLEDMIKTGFINNFANIQVQFHLGIENDISRRDDIHKNLSLNGFRNKFNYPFVWESWTKL